jgi:hypothetical protein
MANLRDAQHRTHNNGIVLQHHDNDGTACSGNFAGGQQHPLYDRQECQGCALLLEQKVARGHVSRAGGQVPLHCQRLLAPPQYHHCDGPALD